MLNEFIESAKPGSVEARLAAKYKSISDELEKLQTTLLQRIRVAKDSRGRLVPIFMDGVEPLSTSLDAKDSELRSVASDIEAYIKACDAPNMEQLYIERAKMRKLLSDIDFELKNTIAASIRKNLAKSATEAESLPHVVEVLAKKERIVEQYQPKLAEIEQRIVKAQEILKKY